jgi:hypothetical protein
MQTLNVYGDSHTRFFALIPELSRFKKKYLAGFDVNVRFFGGSTVLGLPRRKSTLSVNIEISDTVADAITVLNFGQVDVELGYFYRKVVKGEDIDFDDFTERLVESYKTFLSSVMDRARMIIVKGVNPPVLIPQGKATKYIARIISSKQERKKHVRQLELLREMLPSIQERTSMSKRYNARLKKTCDGLGLCYFDIWDVLINKKTGRVKDLFIPARRNHHLVDSVWIRRQHWKALIKYLPK